MLPVLTLYDAFAFHCRDLQQTVQSRLLRLRALIQLDLFHEAHVIIQLLLTGDKLPSTQLTGQYRPNLIEPNASKSKVELDSSVKVSVSALLDSRRNTSTIQEAFSQNTT